MRPDPLATAPLSSVMSGLDLYPFLSRFSDYFAKSYERWRRGRILRFLRRVDPDTLEKISERLAVTAFQQAAERVPYYRDLLHSKGIDPALIRKAADFRRLPLLEKEIFYEADIADLALDGDLESIKNILTSSGFSGKFGFGANSADNLRNTARMIDFVLDMIFEIGRKKTLVISCLPMGVKMYTNLALLAEVSVREDMALALVRKFQKHVDQIIIVGEAFFLKRLAEEGIRSGIDWPSLPVSLVCGEDSFPETYRDYVGGLLGISHDVWPMERMIGSSLGIAEVDLNLFHETPETIRIRRLAERDEKFRKLIFGEELDVTPMLFHYYPHRTFLELDVAGEIIVTTLVPCQIPLIRYNTKDAGRLISYRALESALKEYDRIDLLPTLHLPLAAVKSRHAGSAPHTKIADHVRRAMFSDPEVAKRVTGYFKILDGAGGKQIDLQMEKYFSSETDRQEIAAGLNVEGAKINPIPYYQFPEALTLDYNKKFRH
ncbi:MAG: hypothetical protein UY71_C0009G0006 [Parcubacteria group bacterium GW2011_GWB1_52_7]|nr:MAG: hypothetical protein UY71_C0009G0006 [Parcubacteria group bacterium GW2011_GWB1_52_7]